MGARGSSDGRGAMEVADDGRGGARRCSHGEEKHGRCKKTVTMKMGRYSSWGWDYRSIDREGG
jgi:hypothetical protein